MGSLHAQINERSSVLRCYLGMALAKCGLVGEALDMLQMATVADVKNPLARFERARVLMNLERDEEALAELSALQVTAARQCPDQQEKVPVLAWCSEHAWAGGSPSLKP